MLFTENLLSLFGLSNTTLINGILYFRIFYSVFLGYGIMIMTLTFFQAIGDAKSAGNLVIMRQIVIFVPAMIILPMFLGLKAIWITPPIIDILIIIISIFLYIKTIKKFK